MGQPGDVDWLEDEFRRLMSFGTGARPGAWLTDSGDDDLEAPRQTWLAARALHVRSLGVLLGVAGSEELAQHALSDLAGPFRDDRYDGWHAALRADDSPLGQDKGCYEHMFVLLAATTASRAGIPGADELRTDAERVVTEYFWDESEGMCIDGWSGDWATARTYRGLNACMHGVEAMLAAGGSWTQRAARVCTRVAEFAGAFDWRLPEHFEVDWTPLPQAYRDNPADPFKPYGATVGHGLEWSRLLVSLESVSPDPEGRLLATARHLYQRAVADGWEVDGAPGFVYTTDWSGQAIVHERMHWVLAEAVSAAATLRIRTGEQQYHDDELGWWAYADRHVLDRALGSWHHELDRENRPASSVWPGKPDLYHAVQATLIPRLPLGGSVAAAVQEGLGRTARP